jgi:hypothetical protein
MIKDLTLLRTKTEWELELSDKRRYILISDVDEICGIDDLNSPEDCVSYTLIDCKNNKEVDTNSKIYSEIVKEAIIEIDNFIYGEDEYEDEDENDEDE